MPSTMLLRREGREEMGEAKLTRGCQHADSTSDPADVVLDACEGSRCVTRAFSSLSAMCTPHCPLFPQHIPSSASTWALEMTFAATARESISRNTGYPVSCKSNSGELHDYAAVPQQGPCEASADSGPIPELEATIFVEPSSTHCRVRSLRRSTPHYVRLIGLYTN